METHLLVLLVLLALLLLLPVPLLAPTSTPSFPVLVLLPLVPPMIIGVGRRARHGPRSPPAVPRAVFPSAAVAGWRA